MRRSIRRRRHRSSAASSRMGRIRRASLTVRPALGRRCACLGLATPAHLPRCRASAPVPQNSPEACSTIPPSPVSIARGCSAPPPPSSRVPPHHASSPCSTRCLAATTSRASTCWRPRTSSRCCCARNTVRCNCTSPLLRSTEARSSIYSPAARCALTQRRGGSGARCYAGQWGTEDRQRTCHLSTGGGA